MGVPADHRGDAGDGKASDVVGHDHGGTAQEAVGRADHAGNADRDEVLNSSDVGGLNEVERARAILDYLPVAELGDGPGLA